MARWRGVIEVNPIVSDEGIDDREKVVKVHALLRQAVAGEIQLPGADIEELEYIADDFDLLIDDTERTGFDDQDANRADDLLDNLYSWGDNNRIWLGLPT